MSNEKKNDLGIYSRDRFANLESWKKGRRYPLDSDQDIIEAYKQYADSRIAGEKLLDHKKRATRYLIAL